jgi:hypothetical protein
MAGPVKIKAIEPVNAAMTLPFLFLSNMES